MRYTAAFALAAAALTLPMFAQHSAMRGGASGRGGFAGHAGFSAHLGLSGSGAISRPAPPVGYRSSANSGFRQLTPPMRSDFRSPHNPGNLPAHRPAYGSYSANHSYGGNHRHHHFHYFAPWPRFVGWNGFGVPRWWGYPFVIDPGFYDWSVPNDPAPGQISGAGYGASGYADAGPYGNSGPDVSQPAPQPNTEARVPYSAQRQDGQSADSFPTTPALTVLFNNGRAPAKMQNYMLTATTLTNLDRQHYERIPLDQVNIAATQHANQSNGITFRVPSGSGD